MILSKLDSSSWSYRICKWCLMSRSFSSVFPCTDTAASNSSKDLDWRFQKTDRHKSFFLGGGAGAAHGGRETGRKTSSDNNKGGGGGSRPYQTNRESAERARNMGRLLSMRNQTVARSASQKRGNDTKFGSSIPRRCNLPIPSIESIISRGERTHTQLSPHSDLNKAAGG